MKLKSYQFNYQSLIFLALPIVFIFIAVQAFAATTISSTGVTTDDLDVTLNATRSITIDAAATDHTDTNVGVMNLLVDGAVAEVEGFDIAAINRSGGDMTVERIMMNYNANPAATPLLSTGDMIGTEIDIQGTATDAAGSKYFGHRTLLTGTNGGNAQYTGYQFMAVSQSGGNIQTAGNVLGTEIQLQKTAGAGMMTGSYYSIKNDTGSAATAMYGLNIEMDPVVDAATEAGILINHKNIENSTTRTLNDGLLVFVDHSTDVITDAIDVADAEIVNAINIGANAIAGTNFSVTAGGIATAAGYSVKSFGAPIAANRALTKAELQSASYFTVDSTAAVDLDLANDAVMDSTDVGRVIRFYVTTGVNAVTVTAGASGITTVFQRTAAGTGIEDTGDYFECHILTTSSAICTAFGQD